MNIKDFIAGTLTQQYEFKSFTPSKINLEWTWDNPEINTLLSDANRSLGELNAFSYYIPNIDYFILMHIYKEATTSSKIEGTRTRIDEIILAENEIAFEKRDDWKEVSNYVKAINYSIGKLSELPISSRLIKETHKVLMEGVRGESKLPGEFRKSQNWIGGATIKDATFIPPAYNEIPDLIADLEDFIHNRKINVPDLIKVAIIHYQFETIHPFLDGNGRIGRLLITLYLVNKGLLEKPTLYLSDFIEKNKRNYYNNLSIVKSENNLTQWIKFFLVGISETSNKGIAVLKEILKLKDEIENVKLPKLGTRLNNGKRLVEYLYRKPIVATKEVENLLNITAKPAGKILNDFVSLDILEEITGYNRNRKFAFSKYLKLFSD